MSYNKIRLFKRYNFSPYCSSVSWGASLSWIRRALAKSFLIFCKSLDNSLSLFSKPWKFSTTNFFLLKWPGWWMDLSIPNLAKNKLYLGTVNIYHTVGVRRRGRSYFGGFGLYHNLPDPPFSSVECQWSPFYWDDWSFPPFPLKSTHLLPPRRKILWPAPWKMTTFVVGRTRTNGIQIFPQGLNLPFLFRIAGLQEFKPSQNTPMMTSPRNIPRRLNKRNRVLSEPLENKPSIWSNKAAV